MPRLVVLNGPPGCGKSTLARRYAADHPPALALDVDLVVDMIGGADLGVTGPAARDIAVAAARTHLTSGHDVVVPQFLGRVEFLERLEALAAEVGAAFHEVVLFDTKPNALRRFTARGALRPVFAATEHDLATMHDRLTAVIAQRHPTVITSIEGDEDRTYTSLLTALNA
ncbi:AAA family ATPase [Saccharothrix syringae]|uniref:AAA+ ATPase domain-containing protein n=1 Tax=Saccharothrix syringae TaxID=103733 RepID=A0A5Q0GVM2_SACSY|nr:AAA family ATPase [Saccharothrix syringae]QFZ18058.1 hypothetical protein EKG83_11705 [Saccharothrix syringae]